VRLASGASTDQGQLRTNNEDSFLVDGDRALFAVADGMGGHRGGEVASRTAIEALRAAVASGSALNDAVSKANTAVISRAAGDENLMGMGTTMTAVIVIGGRQLLIAHVGDSRAYLVHDDTMRRVTDDHSLVEELVREGRLTPEQAESHPQRAIVTRALGVNDDVDVDVYTIEVEAGDRLMLCSDGLTTMLRERDIERVLHAERDAQHAADALVDAANDAGGEDNITVVVVDVLEVDPVVPVDSTALQAEVAPEPVATPLPPIPPEASAARPEKTRMRTVRSAILVLIPLVLIIGAATAAIGWYARKSYFVGANANEVVIYKGVPGGVLGWDPTIEQRTGIQLDSLPQIDRDRVETNDSRGSLDTTRGYVARLQTAVTLPTTTTSSTTPTTVKKRPRTTTTTGNGP
jgi:protein phosphatase